jgi:hypothetical protein
MENHELTTLGCIVTRCGLKLPRGMSVERYEAVGHALASAGSTMQWWWGDWYLAFKPKWGDRAAFFAKHPDWPAMSTVQHYAAVCNAFKICRRRQNLSFTHYQMVAGLDPAEADALLDACAAAQPVWTTRALKDKVQDLDLAERQASMRAAAARHYSAVEHYTPVAPPEPYEARQPEKFVYKGKPPPQDEPEKVISADDMRAAVARHYGAADDMTAMAYVEAAWRALQKALALKEVSLPLRAKIQRSFDALPRSADQRGPAA